MKLDKLLKQAETHPDPKFIQWFKEFVETYKTFLKPLKSFYPHPTLSAIVIADSVTDLHLGNNSLDQDRILTSLDYPFVNADGERPQNIRMSRLQLHIKPELLKTLPRASKLIQMSNDAYATHLKGLFDNNVTNSVHLSFTNVATLKGMGDVTTKDFYLRFLSLTTYEGLDQITSTDASNGNSVHIPFLPNSKLVLPKIKSHKKPSYEVRFLTRETFDIYFEQILPWVYDYNVKNNTAWKLNHGYSTFDVDSKFLEAYKKAGNSPVAKDDVLQDAYDDFKHWYDTW